MHSPIAGKRGGFIKEVQRVKSVFATNLRDCGNETGTAPSISLGTSSSSSCGEKKKPAIRTR